MITGQTKVKQEPIVPYRDIDRINVSSLKIFHQKGLNAFYKEFILKERPKSRDEDEEKSSLIIGNVFDFLRIDCEGNLEEFDQRYDEKFTLYSGIKSDSQDFLLADELYRLTLRDRNEEGVTLSSFESRFREAFAEMQNKDKFKGKTVENALDSFNNPPSEKKLAINPNLTSALDYYNEKIANIGKQTVDTYHLDTAKRLLAQSLTDPWVSDIFSKSDSRNDKLVTEWEYDSVVYGYLKCKQEMDISLWDHNTKIVYPKDVKTIFDNRKEQVRRSYHKMLYGWQGAFYTLGLRQWMDKNDYRDWRIAPFEFIFFSTGNTNRPCRLEMDTRMMHEALDGYELNGYKHKGLLSTLQELAFHIKEGVWDGETEQYISNGKIKF